MKSQQRKKKLTNEEFNGYSFGEPGTRKYMKYLVITNGDLDLNGAYAFQTRKDLNDYLKSSYKEVIAVFKIKDITS